MPKAKDEAKGSGLDRRAVIKAALVVGGVSALGVGAAAAAAPQAAPAAEREWARALARHIANQLPEAVRQIPDLGLTPPQIQELRRIFENTLVTNMGCEVPPT